jgi:hypothetical protein
MNNGENARIGWQGISFGILCCIVLLLSCESPMEDDISRPQPVPETGTTQIALLYNSYGGGYQKKYSALPSGARITEGEEYAFTITGISNVDIATLNMALVDTAAEAAYYTALSEYFTLNDIRADIEFNYSHTFNISITATSSRPVSNYLVFSIPAKGSDSPPTLTLTNISLTKK